MYSCGTSCIQITKYLIHVDCSISVQPRLQKKKEGTISQGSKEERHIHAAHADRNAHGSPRYSAPFQHPALRALAVFPARGAAVENSRLSHTVETSEQIESLLGQLLLGQCRGKRCREEALFLSCPSTPPSVTAL